jgi:hypothetical protein
MNIVYLHGFASGPSSSKAVFFARKFEEVGMRIQIPALDEGDFENLTITRQLEVINKAVAGRSVTLIGSSMGGYLAALFAARHQNVEKLVLLAPAFDFGRRLPEVLSGSDVAEWKRVGRRRVFHYAAGGERDLSYRLIEDASTYESYPDARQPTLILHGREDQTVPLTYSQEFASRHPNARVIELDSGHEMTDVLDSLWIETARFLGISTSNVELPGVEPI